MIYNLTKKSVVARRPVSAITFLSRGRGMIGRDFTDLDALVFQNCASIHTFFMRINIDVLFLDRENVIRGLRENLRPWCPLVRCDDAVSVIELPAGAASRSACELGDTLDLNAELTEAEKRKLANGKLLMPTPETVLPIREVTK